MCARCVLYSCLNVLEKKNKHTHSHCVCEQGWSRWEPGDVDPDNKNKPREICPVKKGYGMGINSISIYEGATPYSLLDKLGKVLPGTLDAMKAKQQAWQVSLCTVMPCSCHSHVHL